MGNVVSFSCWSNPAYMKASDRERMEAFICEYPGECEMYKQGKCVCKNLLFGWIKCPHSQFVRNSGLTKRARNFGVEARRWKEQYKTDIKIEISRLCHCGDYVFLPYPHLNVFGTKIDESLENDHFIPIRLFDLNMVEKIIRYRPHAFTGGEIEKFQKEEVPKFIQHLSECFPELFEEYKNAHPEQAERITSVSQNYLGRKAYLHTMKDGSSFYDCHNNLWTKKDGYIVCENYSTLLGMPVGKKPRKSMQELTDDMVVEVRNNADVSEETKFAD